MVLIILAFVCVIVASGFYVKGSSNGSVDDFLLVLVGYGIAIVGLAFIAGFMFGSVRPRLTF